MSDWIAVVYAVYTLVSVALTIWLARTLGTNGRTFLARVFASDPELGDAVNRLLVVGFYLVNFGWACLHLSARGQGDASTVQGAIELLADKLGWLLVALAGMHFANLFVFHRIRRASTGVSMTPPVLPQARLADAAG